jgi:hypothetical protein
MNEPYWGLEDSSITFCETNYATSKYVAEYFNTLSGFSYSIVGLYFLNTNIRNSAWAMILLGLSTSFFHGTMRYYGQWCDEISMIYLSFMLIKEVHPGLSYTLFYILLGLYFMFWDTFAAFFIMFMLMQTYIYLLSMEFRVLKENNYLFIAKDVSIYLAMGCWAIDIMYCKDTEYFHAYWHLLTSISLYLGGKLISNYKRFQYLADKHAGASYLKSE